MTHEKLDVVFNPKESGFLINDLHLPGDSKIMADRIDFENKLNEEVTQNLINDIEDFGVKVNYSIRILINEIALNVIFLSRIKFYLLNRELIQHRYDHKLSSISKSNLNGFTEMKYTPVESKERVHPLYLDYVPKLEKALNHQLGLLGLLPTQQIEKQKIMVIEKMKKRMFEVEQEGLSYRQDININTKKELQIPL